MLLVLRESIFDLIIPTEVLFMTVPKKCPTILYAVNLWLKPVSATGASHNSHCFVNMDNADILLYMLYISHIMENDKWRTTHFSAQMVFQVTM